jgi:hypothetical protein
MAIGIGALALAVAIGTGAYAMRGGDDQPTAVTAEDASTDGSDVATDSDGGEGLGLSAICLEGAEDCVDTVDVPYGDFGELPTKCAAEAVDCVEPGCPPEGCTAGMPAVECVVLETDPPIEECKPIACQTGAEPAEAIPPDELIDPVPDEATIEEQLAADAQAAEAAERERAAASQEAVCVPPLPVCEDPTMSACVPPDCAVSSDGSVSCPGSEPIDCVPVEPATGDDIVTQPCMTEPCVGGPAVDCGPVDPIEPCVPGPATDCGVIDCAPIAPGPDGDVPAICIDGSSGAGGGTDGSEPSDGVAVDPAQ